MNRLDFTDINRFLVSLGLIFYVFAFSIPWLFFKDAAGNQIKLEDFNLLTEQSRNLIDRNLDSLLIISNLIPWISIVLFIGGSFCIYFGMKRWFEKQKVVDEKELIELDILRSNIPTLNKEETVEKAKQEVKLDIQGVVEKVDNERIVVEPAIKNEDWMNLINIEKKIIEKIKFDNPLNYDIKSNVKILDNVVADIVLQSYTKDKQDRIIEVKYFQHIINFQSIAGVLQNMAFFAATYNNRFKKSIAGLLIIVYNEEIANNIKIKELEDTLTKYIYQKKFDFVSFEICKITDLEKLKLDKYY